MKKVIALLLAVLMLASLAACSSTPANADAATPAETGTTPSADTTDTADTPETKDETPAAAGDVTIRMWTFLDPTNTSNGRSIALQKMIDRFEEENPGVKVVVEPQQWDTMTGKFMAAATTGEAPDIMWCARDELFGVLNAGLLEPLENLFMGDWTQEQIDDVDDGFFRFGERDGKHYTLCLNKNCTGFFYREDLLEAAGLEVPTTFDELYDAAQKLTQEIDGQQVYGLGMSFSTETNDAQAIVNWLLQEQGTLFNEDGTAKWANENGVAALEWIKKCIDTGVTPADAVNKTIEDIYTEFASGKYAMTIASAVRLGTSRANASFDGSTIQFAPLPGGTIIDGWFAGVYSGSANKELAGKFLELMYDNESDLLWINDGAQAPNRKSTVAQITIDDSNKYLNSMLDAFAAGWLPANNKAFVGWKLDLNRPIQAILTGETDYMKALSDAETIFNTNNNR